MNASETALTPASIASLGYQGSYDAGGALFNQPLYIPGVTIGGATYNVLLTASMSNVLTAWDADTPNSSPIWQTAFAASWSNWPSTSLDVGQLYHQPLGILSTPVVDVADGYIYLVTTDSTPQYAIHKVVLSTGAEAASTVISGSVSGTGSGSSGGTLAFTPINHTQRTPLALANGKVYFGFGSLGSESAAFHGWVFAYNTSDLSQAAVLCLSPNGIGAGVWEAGGGFAVDGSGNLYFATGNGDYDGSSNWGQSVIKVNQDLIIQDWFTPSNNATTTSEDADLSSGRVMLIPGTSLLTIGSKDGRIWVIDTTNMGHLQGSGAVPQVFSVPESFTPGAVTGIYGGLFFGSVGYFPTATFPTFAFSFSGSTYNTTAAAQTSDSFNQVTFTGSSNAGANPIVWAVTVSSSAYNTQRPAVLRAFNPSTLAEYGNWGALAHYAKFAAPLVANGRVYVASSDGVVSVFGLIK